jgi:hypothetical protein
MRCAARSMGSTAESAVDRLDRAILIERDSEFALDGISIEDFSNRNGIGHSNLPMIANRAFGFGSRIREYVPCTEDQRLVGRIPTMSLARPLEDHERRAWSSDRGSLTFVRHRRNVCLVTFVGRLTDDAVDTWNDHFPWLVGSAGPISLFLDGSQITLLSAPFIGAGTKAVAGVRDRLGHAEVLVDGTLVEMIAKTANMTLGGIMQIGRDRRAFETRTRRLQDGVMI